MVQVLPPLAAPVARATGALRIRIEFQQYNRQQHQVQQYNLEIVARIDNDDRPSEESTRSIVQTIESGFSRGEGQTLSYLHVVKPEHKTCTFLYRVRGKDKNGFGPYSAYSLPCFVPNRAAPNPCKILLCESINAKCMDLKWEYFLHDQVVEYEIQMQALPSEKWYRIASADVPELHLKTLQPEIFYRFRVRARNQFGWSSMGAPSDEVVCTPGPPIAPSVPLVSIVDSNTIHIQWSHHIREVANLIRQTLDKEKLKQSTREWNLEERFHPDRKAQEYDIEIPNDTIFRFRVQSETIYGESPWSEYSSNTYIPEPSFDVHEVVWEAATNGYQAIDDLMLQYAYNSTVIARCTRVLWRKFQDYFIQGMQTKCTNLSTYELDGEFQDDDEVAEAAHLELTKNFISNITDHMKTFGECTDVQKWGIRATSIMLRHLIIENPDDAIQYIHVVLDRIKTAIGQYPNNNKIVQWGLQELTLLAAASKSVKQGIPDGGGVGLLVSTLQSNPNNAAIYFWGLQVLIFCMANSVLYLHEAKAAGLDKVCQKALVRFEENQNVVDLLKSAQNILITPFSTPSLLRNIKCADGAHIWVVQFLDGSDELLEREMQQAATKIQSFYRGLGFKRMIETLLTQIRAQMLKEEMEEEMRREAEANSDEDE